MDEFKSLSEYQKVFLSDVTGNNEQKNKDLLDSMIPIGKLSPESVIDVYRDDYRARLQEVLESNYETCWLILGDVEFAQLCQAYIKDNPSKLSNLTSYGESFDSFSNDKIIQEMAFFEKSYWGLFHSSDFISKFEMTDFNQETLMEDSFDLGAGISFVRSDYNLEALWLLRDSKTPPEDLGEFKEDSYFILYKKIGKIEIVRLGEAVYLCLQGLANGESISEVSLHLNEKNIDLNNLSPTDWQQVFDIIASTRKM